MISNGSEYPHCKLLGGKNLAIQLLTVETQWHAIEHHTRSHNRYRCTYRGAPSMPLMAGSRSSIGPMGMSIGWAPSAKARL